MARPGLNAWHWAVRRIRGLWRACTVSAMRKLSAALIAAALAVPVMAAPASAAAQSCPNVKATAGQRMVLATKVTAKNLNCAEAKAFWTSYVSTGEVLPPKLEDLRTNCKPGPKAARKKAAKKNRMAYVCKSSNGKVVTTAWVLGG